MEFDMIRVDAPRWGGSIGAVIDNRMAYIAEDAAAVGRCVQSGGWVWPTGKARSAFFALRQRS